MPFSNIDLPKLGPTIGTYCRRVTQVQAMEWTGNTFDFDDLHAFCHPTIVGMNTGGEVYLYTKTGVQLVTHGDFIVKEVDGSGVYAVQPGIFHKLYEYGFDHAEMRA